MAEPPPPSNLEILWRTPIVNYPSQYSLNMNPIVYKDRVIFATEYFLNGHSAPIMFMDTATGKILKYWNDYIDGPDNFTDYQSGLSENFLLLSDQSSVNCINLETQQRQWATEFDDCGPSSYLYQGYIYTSIYYNNERTCAIIRSPNDREEWDTIYAYTRTTDKDPTFTGIGVGALPNGDRVVVWKNLIWHASSGRTGIFAYNMTADSLLWRNTQIQNIGSTQALQVENSVVYGTVDRHAFAINLEDGSIKWIRDFKGVIAKPRMANIDFGNLFLHGDAMIIQGTGPEVVFINKSDGELRQVKEVPDAIPSWYSYFDGKLFYCSISEIIILDVYSGDVLFRTDENPDFRGLRSKIAIDPKRKVMYFNDGRYAYCARIPKDI